MEQIEDHTQVTEIENGNAISQSQGNAAIQQNSSQGIQGQSVIQQNQQSVIQSPQSSVHGMQPTIQAQLQMNQQGVQVQGVSESEEASMDDDSKKRRDILSRRPSYRKIFNDLSSSDSPNKIETIQEDSLESSDQSISAISTTAISYQQGSQTVTIPGTIQIVTSGGEAVQGLQAMPISAATATGQATVVQYQPQQDGQQYIYTATPGEVQVSGTGTTMYTIPAGQQQYIRAGQIQQGLVLNQSGMSPGNQQVVAEEATRKREMRLMKNREAAKECRRKKKEYVKCLENRVAVLENQNKTLIEELKALKDLYCHKSE